MSDATKRRHDKQRARIKAHFAEKRAAKTKAAAPKPTPTSKPSPASTAGKTMSYYGGKSTVIDLGHKPSKSAIAGAVSKLRKAKAATKPKATASPPSAAKASPITLPTAPKPTTSNPATSKKGDFVTGLAIAGGTTALVAGSVKLAMKKPKTPPAPAKTPPTPHQTRVTAANKGLSSRHDARRAAQGAELKGAFGAVDRADARKKAALGARHDARTAKQGTGLRHAFEAVERADARAAAKPASKPATKITSLGKNPSPIKIAEARAKGQKTPATQETSMALKIQDARASAAITKATAGFQDRATAVQKSEKREADRRSGGSRRSPSRMTKKQAGVESGVGIRNESPLANKQGNRRKKGSDPRGAKIETVKTTSTTGAPKPVDLSSGGQAPITKTAAPNVAQVPRGAVVAGKPSKAKATPDGAEPKAIKLTGEQRQAANQAARSAIRSGDPVAAKKALAGLPETGRKAARYRAQLAAPKAPAAPKAVSLTGAQRQSANQAARAAMRSGDAASMKKALAGLPETGKKAIKYRSNLEAGIQSAGNKPAEAANKAPTTTTVATKPKRDTSYKQRKQDFRDRQNRIDPKTGRPMQLPQGTRTVEEIEAHKTRSLMETTIEDSRITPQREAAEARDRASKLGKEAQTELVVREGKEASGKKGKAPMPTGREPANRGQGKAVAKAAVKSPAAPTVTANEAAHEKMQRFNAEGRQTENVNVKALAEQVNENAKLGQADNMRQKMARGAATAVLKQSKEATSAAKPKAISLTSQSSTPAPTKATKSYPAMNKPSKLTFAEYKAKKNAELEASKSKATTPNVTKTEAYRQYEQLKETGVKSPTAGKVKPKATTPKVQSKLTGPHIGEQLPRAPAKGRVLPPISDVKIELGRGDKSPPKTPAKLYPAMNKPSKFTFADSIRKYAQRISKPLTGPAIGAQVGENITKPKSKVGATIKGGLKAGAVLTGLFALGEAGVSAAAEKDPSKRAGKAKAAFKEGAKHTAIGVAGYTAAAAATKAVAGKAIAGAIFGTALPAYLTYKTAKEFTIPKLKELGSAIGEAKYAKNAAALEKKGSEAKYGTIERATKTRHAKEAIKKKQKDLLTGGK